MPAPNPSLQRSQASLRHHFDVEKELADRLRQSRREERGELVPHLYSELYRRVPDHPRSDRAKDIEATARTVRNQMRLLQPFVTPQSHFVEFGAGSGALCRAMKSKVSRVVAMEVCAQTNEVADAKEGLEWVYHNGLEVPIPDASFDLAFSYQVLEHIHPDDVLLHLKEAFRILRPGGRYVISTPHEFSGPHDISRYFTDELQTFHLKEWTYSNLKQELSRAGFTSVGSYQRGVYRGALGMSIWLSLEKLLSIVNYKSRKIASRKILNNVVLSAQKTFAPSSPCTASSPPWTSSR